MTLAEQLAEVNDQIAESLALIRTYKARLRELDHEPVEVQTVGTYTSEDGQTYDFTGYRDSLHRSIAAERADLKELIEQRNILAGPFEVRSVAR